MSIQGTGPVVIRRKKVIAAAGHHGGAWKVAYADFVTAMMAFFLMMWLLNATTEDQRKELADYFSPTIPISRTTGGSDGLLSGATTSPDRGHAEASTGRDGSGDAARLDSALEKVVAELNGSSGESTVADPLLEHIVTRVTDEGLAVDLFDLPGAPLFYPNGGRPTRLGMELLRAVDMVFSAVENPIAVSAHVKSEPIIQRRPGVWAVTAARGETARSILANGGTGVERMARVAAHGDRIRIESDPMDPRNNRLELILLRNTVASR